MSSYNDTTPLTEQAQMQKQVEHVLAPYVKSPNAAQLMANWRFNKDRFLKWFHGPIYEYPEKVFIELNAKEKEDLFDRFKHDLEELSIFEGYDSWVCNVFVDFFNYITAEEFFENKFEKFTSMVLYNGDDEEEGFSFKKGTKILKSLNTFDFSEDWHDMIHEVQDFASTYIQKSKLSGILCLSVHPLDFLSLSETAENWRSCHALDGEYRAGNLEYIQNCSTFIAYIKTPHDKYLPRFPDDMPWNSKKWRTIFFLSNDGSIMFAGRSYPFQSMQALDKVKEIFGNLTGKTSSFWYDTYATLNFPDEEETNCWINKAILIGSDFYPVKNLFGKQGGSVNNQPESYDPLFYNDVLLSNRYTPLYAYFCAVISWMKPKKPGTTDIMYHNATRPETTFIEAEEPVYCMHCGQQLITESEKFVCEYCYRDGYGTNAYEDRRRTRRQQQLDLVEMRNAQQANEGDLYEDAPW